MKEKAANHVVFIAVVLLINPLFSEAGKRKAEDDPNPRPVKVRKIDEATYSSFDDSTDESSDSDMRSEIGEEDSNERSEELADDINDVMRINPSFSLADASLVVAARSFYESSFDIAFNAIADGANVNIVDDVGMTPLILAAGAGNMAMMELLLDYHANPNALDRNGNSILVVAMGAPCARMYAAQLLVIYGGEVGDREVQAAFDAADGYARDADPDSVDQYNVWMAFARSLLSVHVAAPMTIFAQVNLQDNVVPFPADVLNLIGNLMVQASLSR